MSDALLICLIGNGLTLVGTIITVAATNHKNRLAEAVRDARLEDRLTSVEHKLDIHNGYAKKLGSIDVQMAEMRKDISYLREGQQKC